MGHVLISADDYDEYQEQKDEIERLREALKDLLDVVPILPKDAKNIVGMEHRYNNALDKARSALQQKESE